MEAAAKRGDHPRLRCKRGKVKRVYTGNESANELDAPRALRFGAERIEKIARQRRTGMHEDAHAGREQIENVAGIRTALHRFLWTAHLLVRNMARLNAHQEVRGPALIPGDFR